MFESGNNRQIISLKTLSSLASFSVNQPNDATPKQHICADQQDIGQCVWRVEAEYKAEHE
jgi:hypothetical protein